MSYFLPSQNNYFFLNSTDDFLAVCIWKIQPDGSTIWAEKKTKSLFFTEQIGSKCTEISIGFRFYIDQFYLISQFGVIHELFTTSSAPVQSGLKIHFLINCKHFPIELPKTRANIELK